MQVILYKYNGRMNTITKELPTSSLTLEGVLKEGTSLLNPSILIESTNYDRVVNDSNIRVGYLNNGIFRKIAYNQLERLFDYNYAYIPDFKRYYFITDINSFRTNLWRIDMKVDVLKTYESDILKQECYVLRNQYKYDVSLEDNLITYDTTLRNFIYKPENGDMVNFSFDVISNNPDRLNCTLTVVNTDSSGYYRVARPLVGDLDLPQTDITWEQSISNSVYAVSVSTLKGLTNRIVSTDYSKLSSGIITMVQFPFTLSVSGYTDLSVLDTTFSDTGLRCYYLSSTSFKNLILADFIFSVTNDMFYYYKSSYLFYIPYVGYVNISPQDFINKRIIIFYNVDYSSGKGIVNVYNYTDKILIYYCECQLGRSVPITYSNYYDYISNITGTSIKSAISSVVGLGMTVGGTLTGNIPLAIAGTSTAINSLGSIANSAITNHITGTSAVNDVSLNALQPQTFFIKCIVPQPINEDSIRYEYGLPLNKHLLLSDLKGMTICNNVHLDNISNATKTEQDEIKSLLENGVYID